MSTKLTMRRDGTFKCDFIRTAGKCGSILEQCPEYYYECEIVAKPILDENDFLIDQLDIDEYFQKRYKCGHQPQSCERIALNAIDDIKFMLAGHLRFHQNRDIEQIVYSIRISIGFNSDIAMTAEWTPQ